LVFPQILFLIPRSVLKCSGILPVLSTTCDDATELMSVPSGIIKSCLSQTRTNLLYCIFNSLITNRLILSVTHDSLDRSTNLNRLQHVAVQLLIRDRLRPRGLPDGRAACRGAMTHRVLKTFLAAGQTGHARVADGEFHPAQS